MSRKDNVVNLNIYVEHQTWCRRRDKLARMFGVDMEHASNCVMDKLGMLAFEMSDEWVNRLEDLFKECDLDVW